MLSDHEPFGPHMPRFFFDIRDGGSHCRDEEGTDLPDLRAARGEALMALSETARDALREAGDRHEVVAEVRDETGRLVLTASLSLVVQQVA